MLSDKEKILYSSVVVVAVGLGMFILRQSKSTPVAVKPITYQDITTERNAAIARDKIEKQAVAVKNFQTAPRLDNNLRDVKDGLEDDSSGIRLESEKNHSAQDIAEVYEAPLNSLETKINEKLVNDQKAAQMSQIQKRNFVENYKKRALAMGYKVELNDKLELIRADKVKPVTIPTSRPSAVEGDVETWEDDNAFEDEE